jgi:hypothetical protein
VSSSIGDKEQSFITLTLYNHVLKHFSLSLMSEKIS